MPRQTNLRFSSASVADSFESYSTVHYWGFSMRRRGCGTGLPVENQSRGNQQEWGEWELLFWCWTTSVNVTQLGLTVALTTYSHSNTQVKAIWHEPTHMLTDPLLAAKANVSLLNFLCLLSRIMSKHLTNEQPARLTLHFLTSNETNVTSVLNPAVRLPSSSFV